MLNSIQALRAFAAWLVVFHHYIQVMYNFSLQDPFSTFLFKYGAIGVDLFFIISGFVIYTSAQAQNMPPKNFAIHRIARIAPVYWFFTLLTAASLVAIPNSVALTENNSVFMLQSLFFIPAQNPSGIGLFPLITVGWTLNFEMVFYLVFLMSLFLPSKFRPLAIAAGIVLLYKIPKPTGSDLSFYSNRIMYEFLLGIGIAILHRRHITIHVPLYASAAGILLSLITIAHYGEVTHDPWKQGVPCAVIVFSFLAQERLFRNTGLVHRLADWSYSTYLCHIIVISYVAMIKSAFGIGFALSLALAVVLILAVSSLSFYFIERPVLTYAKKVTRSAKSAHPLNSAPR